jgi:hypothetical protein
MIDVNDVLIHDVRFFFISIMHCIEKQSALQRTNSIPRYFAEAVRAPYALSPVAMSQDSCASFIWIRQSQCLSTGPNNLPLP